MSDEHTETILLSRIAHLERRLQGLADLVCPHDEGCSELPEALLVEPDSQAELAQGFHLREWDAAGRAFRWAGRAEYFEFRFFVDRSRARGFRMRGLFAPAVDPEALTAFVDYRAIPLRIERDGGLCEISGSLPADRLSPGVTLTFFCATQPSPRPEDTRRLSFAFSRLQVGAGRSASAAGDMRVAHAGAVTRVGVAQAGIVQIGAAQAVTAQAVVAQAVVAQAVVAHTVVAHTGVAQTGVLMTGVAQTGVAQTGVAQTGAPQAAIAQTGMAHVGAPQAPIVQTVIARTAMAHTGAPHTGVAQIGAAQTVARAAVEAVMGDFACEPLRSVA